MGQAKKRQLYKIDEAKYFNIRGHHNPQNLDAGNKESKKKNVTFIIYKPHESNMGEIKFSSMT